ncbi:PDR/VanB family oxidoreductase [Tsukamurella soli]|uniref:PDR/VanB family oxidoreductase n=1 Tax=Tsukamurella soli TaxID=644556 RepID=A0ABP8JNT0_9ACTN
MAEESGGHATTLGVRVEAARREAAGVTSYVLTAPDGAELPRWSPGAHVDVHLPSGTVRQYSLCGDPADRRSYRIAVLEQPAGRGGSVEVHRELRPGAAVQIGLPRSNFELVPARRYVFVAGGIGITPVLPMIRQVAASGIEWELVYGARTHGHFAFLGELAAHGDRVRTVPQDTAGVIDLDKLARGAAGAAVFCCGPAPLMDALVDAMAAAGHAGQVHLERFGPVATPVRDAAADDASGPEFVVELTRSGITVPVPRDVSVLDAVRGAGVDIPSSCEMGICGTCETTVLEGEVDHRDDLYTEAERATCGAMLVCVSRACGRKLVLDA